MIQEHWQQAVFKVILQKQMMWVQQEEESCRCGQRFCHVRLDAPNTLCRLHTLVAKCSSLGGCGSTGTDTVADLDILHLRPFMHTKERHLAVIYSIP